MEKSIVLEKCIVIKRLVLIKNDKNLGGIEVE